MKIETKPRLVNGDETPGSSIPPIIEHGDRIYHKRDGGFVGYFLCLETFEDRDDDIILFNNEMQCHAGDEYMRFKAEWGEHENWELKPDELKMSADGRALYLHDEVTPCVVRCEAGPRTLLLFAMLHPQGLDELKELIAASPEGGFTISLDDD